MAWRPSTYLIEGELDNTTPGTVTGWMQFAGLPQRVTFALRGDFHRDIRGAKLHLHGDGQADDPAAAEYLAGFAGHQTGEVGDMTAGLPPRDYVSYPYLEWYGDLNGRVVLELERRQVRVIGRPIPACESDPIPREAQNLKLADFLARLATAADAPAVAVGGSPLVSDPAFTHWVVAEGHVIGEARAVQPDQNGTCSAYVRLFQMTGSAEYGRIEQKYLREKATGLVCDHEADGDGPTGEMQP